MLKSLPQHYTEYPNIHGTHEIADSSTNDNEVFFSVFLFQIWK